MTKKTRKPDYCDLCDGTGIDPDPEEEESDCPKCKGTGFAEAAMPPAKVSISIAGHPATIVAGKPMAALMKQKPPRVASNICPVCGMQFIEGEDVVRYRHFDADTGEEITPTYYHSFCDPEPDFPDWETLR